MSIVITLYLFVVEVLLLEEGGSGIAYIASSYEDRVAIMLYLYIQSHTYEKWALIEDC